VRAREDANRNNTSPPLPTRSFKKKGKLLSKKQSQLRTFLKHWKEKSSPRIRTRGGKKEGGVGTKQKSLRNTGYCGGKAFQTHEGVYISLPLFSFTQKAHTPSFVSSNRYTIKAFEYSQVAKASNFATAMARGLKPLDPFLPPSLGKSHTKTIIIIIIIISSRPHTQHKITSP
jgi:hypothetical protein